MAQFISRISHPAMTDLSIDFGGLQVTELFPARLPDLYVGRPVVITGRFAGGGEHVLKIRGNIAGEKRDIPMPVNFSDAASTHTGITAVWARMKIGDLADRSAYETVAELPQQIKQVALQYGLMSSFTAFVAVDSMSQTGGDHGTSVAVPVPMPEGVRYETTVMPK